VDRHLAEEVVADRVAEVGDYRVVRAIELSIVRCSSRRGPCAWCWTRSKSVVQLPSRPAFVLTAQAVAGQRVPAEVRVIGAALDSPRSFAVHLPHATVTPPRVVAVDVISRSPVERFGTLIVAVCCSRRRLVELRTRRRRCPNRPDAQRRRRRRRRPRPDRSRRSRRSRSTWAGWRRGNEIPVAGVHLPCRRCARRRTPLDAMASLSTRPTIERRRSREAPFQSKRFSVPVRTDRAVLSPRSSWRKRRR